MNGDDKNYFTFSCSPPRRYIIQDMEMETQPSTSSPSSPLPPTNTAGKSLLSYNDGVIVDEMDEDVSVMVQAKYLLEKVEKSRQKHEYKEIVSSIKKYLHHFCNHHYVIDTFDVDVERSLTIEYCTICEDILK